MWGKYTVFEKVQVQKISVVCWEKPHPSRAATFAASGWTEKDRSEGVSLPQLASVRQWNKDVRCNVKLYTTHGNRKCTRMFVAVYLNCHLCNPGQLSAELGQNGVLLGLNIIMKLRLDLPCGCVQQNSRKLNCIEGRKERGTYVISNKGEI